MANICILTKTDFDTHWFVKDVLNAYPIHEISEILLVTEKYANVCHGLNGSDHKYSLLIAGSM